MGWGVDGESRSHPAHSPARGGIAAALDRAFLADASALQLALAVGLPILGAAWLLLSPDRLLSREMTWDLLFNLAGAWAIHTDQVPHVDFHDPLGALNFVLTQLGFHVVGESPLAFLVGEIAVLAFVFATAFAAAVSRLPPVPAAIFILYVSLLVLMPTNVGDLSNVYSFAMSYNRWCWSTLTILCLIVFLPPRAGRLASWVDAPAAGLLIVAMFHLKLTYAAAGMAALLLALVISDHIRARWRMWSVVAALVLANAVAPYNHPYLIDFWEAATSGRVRDSWLGQIRIFFDNKAEYALHGSGILLLCWLALRRAASPQPLIAACFILGTGSFLLSQNAQLAGIPTGIVIAYLVYGAVCGERRHAGRSDAPGIIPMLAAILMFPALSVGAAGATLIGYHVAATRDDGLLVVDSTNLSGLAVPVDEAGAPDASTLTTLPYQMLGSGREARPRYDVTQFEYVQTLLEAAAFFADGRLGQPKIQVFDQVNPLPFMLGYPAPRGASLWPWSDEMPTHAAEDLFGDADYVLLPKLPTQRAGLAAALTKYSGYLSQNFPVHRQTPNWTILSRR